MTDNNNKLRATVGIATCYGGVSLKPVIKSIKASQGNYVDKIILIADRTPITKEMTEFLKMEGVDVVWNEISGTHNKKIRQIRDLCQTDILITICDDVILDPLAISEIMRSFNDDEVTVVSSNILPLPPQGFFESAVSSSPRIIEKIVRSWNKGDNYLATSGRCISFRNSFFKKFRMPDEIVTNDQFFYFENKRLGGKIRHNENSIAHIRAPQNLKDHMRPSSRYQFGIYEVSRYFDHDISKEYKIPVIIKIKAFLGDFLSGPIRSTAYLMIFIYSRLAKMDQKNSLSSFWSEGASTKKL